MCFSPRSSCHKRSRNSKKYIAIGSIGRLFGHDWGFYVRRFIFGRWAFVFVILRCYYYGVVIGIIIIFVTVITVIIYMFVILLFRLAPSLMVLFSLLIIIIIVCIMNFYSDITVVVFVVLAFVDTTYN